MFDVDRILAMPDSDRDFVQMGLTTKAWAIIEKTGKTKDGKAAKPSLLKQDRSKTLIKGDKKLSEVSESPKPVFKELDSSIAKKVKGAIADQRSINSSGRRSGKSNTQKSDQAYQLHEKTKQSHEKARDKFIGLSDELGALRDKAQEAKGKVETGRTKKRASEMKDAFKFNNALEAEAMNNGQAVPVMRQKANKKQMASINDKINQKENEMFAAQSRTNQLKARANKLFDASQDYSNKNDATPSKSRKVIKGKSPRDRSLALGKLKEQKERIEDMISTKKSLNQDVPQAWLDKYSQVSAALNPKKETNSVKQGSGEAYSLPVYGHPENHGYVRVGDKDVRTGFIPYKVNKDSDMSNSIFHAEKLYKDLTADHFTKEGIAQGRVKATAKKKKEAKSYLVSVTAANNLSMIKTLKSETIPELYRLDKEVEKLKKSASKAPSATAKKLNLTAAKEAEILKSVKRF